MIERAVFYDRLDNHCKACQHWKGVCLKGHALASPEGCPLRKFPPVNGAGYLEEQAVAANAPAIVNCCGNADMPAMTWGQVLVAFASSMVTWIKAGVPLVNAGIHGVRYDQCKVCPYFRSFYCDRCRCVAYLKTKLATEACPLPAPRWVSAISPVVSAPSDPGIEQLQPDRRSLPAGENTI